MVFRTVGVEDRKLRNCFDPSGRYGIFVQSIALSPVGRPKCRSECSDLVCASLDSPAGDGLLQRCIAAMLGLRDEDVDIVHSIGEIEGAIVTCVVGGSSADSYSQLIALHISEALPVPGVPKGAARLARALDRSLLLANAATANPYSFIRVPNAGRQSVVRGDPAELDENDGYVIREPGQGNDGVPA